MFEQLYDAIASGSDAVATFYGEDSTSLHVLDATVRESSDAVVGVTDIVASIRRTYGKDGVFFEVQRVFSQGSGARTCFLYC